MKEMLHKNFHIIEEMPAGGQKIFILDTWKPPEDIWLVGCAIGLLCMKTKHYELYLAISRNPELKPGDFFVGMKKDWLFYQQRDAYSLVNGIDDLISYHFLPGSQGFLIKKGEPLYIKVGAGNFDDRDLKYDAFCNLYYTLP